MSMKRKTPSTVSPSPGPAGGRLTAVKPEPQDTDAKRQKSNSAGPSRLIATSHGMYQDTRTAALSMSRHLKEVSTMGWQDAYLHAASEYPGHDPQKLLEMLKSLERVEFNEVNQVFTWIPELTIVNDGQLRTYLRTNSTPTQGVFVRDIREAMPPGGLSMIEELERKGDVLVMRSLTGLFKDPPLPKLGQANVHGLKINDGGSGGYQRMRSVWWDDTRERGKAGTRVDDELITAWDEVQIAPTDDIVELLERESLGAGSAMPAAPKTVVAGPAKKKKVTRRPLKISNVHMKAQGIDFSQDYVRDQ